MSASAGTRLAVGASEPAAGLSVAATLAEVIDAGHGPRARVRLTIIPNESDAIITVTRVTQEEGSTASASSLADRPALVKTSVAKGARKRVLVETDVEAGRDNDLFFLVSAKGKATEHRQVVHLLVSLDESKQPEIIGDHIQYQGGTAQESEP